MDLLTELSLPLSRADYKRLVSGEDCQVAAQQAIKELLEQTMEKALGERIRACRLERGPTADRRNGAYERSLLTSWGWIGGIRVPRGRVSSVADVVLPRYARRQPEFDAAVMGSFLLGHSTRGCKRFFEQFLGQVGVSHSQVSRILACLDERCRAWRQRPLSAPYAYLWLDGKCAAIRGAVKRPYSVLWAYGATEDGRRELLGFQIHRSEAICHWESLLADLLERGLDPQTLKLVIRDENSACEQAVISLLGNVPQQACAIHLQRNLAAHLSKPHRHEVLQAVGEIFTQDSLPQARARLKQLLEQWMAREPAACLYLRAHVDRSLVFYSVAGSPLWRTQLKSTNLLERFFRELKRFEKSRQFRFADNRCCERFYYALALDYNSRHPRMPHWPVTQKC